MKSFLARFTDRHPSHSKPTSKESHKSRLVQSDTEAFSSHKPSSSRHDPVPLTLPLPHVDRPSLDRRPPSRAGRPLQTPQLPIHELPPPTEDPRVSRAGDRPVYHSTRPPVSMPTPVSNHPIPLPSRAASAKARDVQPPLDLPVRSETHPIPSTPAPKEPSQLRSRRESVVIPPLPARDVWHPASSSYPRRPEPPPRDRHFRHESQDDRRPHAEGPELQEQPDRRPKVRNRLVKEGGDRDREERERQKERMRMRDREREREAEKAREDKIQKDQEEQRKRDEEEQQRRRQLERRERRAKEKEEAEREREVADRERQAKERLERERAEKEHQERERTERERLETERVERMAAERLEREKLEKEKLEQEKRERQERAEARERVRQERRERERAERERQAKEKAERERQERERQERERERQERERQERERLDRERLERERERERQEKERRERERAQKEHAEKERLDKEQREREWAEREHQERERRERERAENERREREQQEREQQERERKERERREQELLERERGEKELQERERQERERREREMQERERRERETQERERKERELQEKERREWELQEKERRERELQEKERRERELQERERRERELQERERKDKERRERQEKERQEQERQDKERQEKERQDRQRQEKEREDRLAAERDQIAKALAEKERVAREHADRERAESERQAREFAEKQEKYERDLLAERGQRDKERAELEIGKDGHDELEAAKATKERADREQVKEEKRLPKERGDGDEERYGKYAREGHREERRHRDSHIDYRDKERPRERPRHTTREPDHVEQDKPTSKPPPRNSPEENPRRRTPEETGNMGPEEPLKTTSKDATQDRDVPRQRESDRSRRRQTRFRGDPATDGEHEQPKSRYSTLDRDRKNSGWTSDYQASSERRHTRSNVVLRPDPASAKGILNGGNNTDAQKVSLESTSQHQQSENGKRTQQHAPPEIGHIVPLDSAQVIQTQPAPPSRPRESLSIPAVPSTPPFQPPSPAFRIPEPPSNSPRLPLQGAGIPDSPQGAPPKPTYPLSEHGTKVISVPLHQLPHEPVLEQQPPPRIVELSKPSPSPRTQQPQLAETGEAFGSLSRPDPHRSIRKTSIDQSPKDIQGIASSALVMDQDRPVVLPKPTRLSPRGSATLLVDHVDGAAVSIPIPQTTERNYQRKDEKKRQSTSTWSRVDGGVADSQVVPVVAPSPIVAHPKPDQSTPVRSTFVPPPQPLPKRSSSTAPQLSFQRPEPVIRPPTSMGYVGADHRISTSTRDMPAQPITLTMTPSQRLNSNEAFPPVLPVERSSRDYQHSAHVNSAMDRPPLAPLPLQDNVRSGISRPIAPPADLLNKVPEPSWGVLSNTKNHQPVTTVPPNPHQIWRPPSMSRPPSLNPAIHSAHPPSEAMTHPSFSHSRPPSIAAVPSQGFGEPFKAQHPTPSNPVDVAKRYSYINPTPMQFVASSLPSDPLVAPQDSMAQVRLDNAGPQVVDKTSSRNSLLPVPTPQVSTIRLPSSKLSENIAEKTHPPLETSGHHRRPSDSMREPFLPPLGSSVVGVLSKIASTQFTDQGRPVNPQTSIGTTSRSYPLPLPVQGKKDDFFNVAPTFVPPPLLPRPPSRASVRLDLPAPGLGYLDHHHRQTSQDFGPQKQEPFPQVVDSPLGNNVGESQPHPVQTQPTAAPNKDGSQFRDESRKSFTTVPPLPLPRPPSRANQRLYSTPADAPRNVPAQLTFTEDSSPNYRPIPGSTSAQIIPINSPPPNHGPRIADSYHSQDPAQPPVSLLSPLQHSNSVGATTSLVVEDKHAVRLPKARVPETLLDQTPLPSPPTVVPSQPHSPVVHRNTMEVHPSFPDPVESRPQPSIAPNAAPRFPSDPQTELEANGTLASLSQAPPTNTAPTTPHHIRGNHGLGPDAHSVKITSQPVPPSPVSKGSPASRTLLDGANRTNVDALSTPRPEAEPTLRALPPSQNSSRTRLIDPVPEPKASPNDELSKRPNTTNGRGSSKPVDTAPQVHTPQTQLQATLPPGAANQATSWAKNSREQIVAPSVAHVTAVERRDGLRDTPVPIAPISEAAPHLSQPTIRAIQRDLSKPDGRPGPIESTGQEGYSKSLNVQQQRVDPVPETKGSLPLRYPAPGEDAEARPVDGTRFPPHSQPGPVHKINHPVLADLLFSPAPKPALALSRSTKHDRSPSGPTVEDIAPVDQPDVEPRDFSARRPSENAKPMPVEYVHSNSGRPSKPLNDPNMPPTRRPDDVVVGGPRRPTESFPPVRPSLAHPTPSRAHVPDSSNVLANPRHSQAPGASTPLPGVAHTNPRYSTVPRTVPPRSSQTPVPQPIHSHPPIPPQSAPARQVIFDEDPRRNLVPSRPEPRSTLPLDARPPSTRPGKGHQPSASLPVTLNPFHPHPKGPSDQPPAPRLPPSTGLRPLDTASQPRVPEPTQLQGRPPSLRRAGSEETILMTPSSLNQSIMLKPTTSNQSITPSVNSQPRNKGGFLGMFRKNSQSQSTPAVDPTPPPVAAPQQPQPRAPPQSSSRGQPPAQPRQHEIWRPKASSKTPDSSPKRQVIQTDTEVDTRRGAPDALASRRNKPLPPPIKVPDDSDKKPFNPFHHLKERRNRGVSVASMEAQDGASTIIGSPTASLHSQVPIYIPPKRDPVLYAEEWRNVEIDDLNRRQGKREGKPKRVKRPGIVWDLAEDPPEDTERPPPPRRLRRRSTSRQQQRGEQS